MVRRHTQETVAAIAPKTDPTRGYARHQVWQALRNSGEFTDLSSIALSSGVGQSDCRKILAQLEAEGFVIRAGNTYKPLWSGRKP